MFHKKHSAQDEVQELAHRCDKAANHQLVAYSWGLLSLTNSFHGGIFKLHTKFDGDLLLYSLSHFECDSHTIHMLTQWCLLPPLTSTVKSSLFTHVHSSSLFLAARLHWCCTNHSHYINSGWTFSGQKLYSVVDNTNNIQSKDKINIFKIREKKKQIYGKTLTHANIYFN